MGKCWKLPGAWEPKNSISPDRTSCRSRTNVTGVRSSRPQRVRRKANEVSGGARHAPPEEQMMTTFDHVKITPREQQILNLLVQGCSNREIAGELKIDLR